MAFQRQTPQRRAILDAIRETKGSFRIADIHARARRRHRTVGLATTYRTIEHLRNEGAVRVIRSDDGFAYVRCRRDHHHHLVCVSCGSVEETDLCAAPSDAALRRRHGFVADSHELEIYGTCRRCA